MTLDKRGRSKTYRSWESMKQRCLNPRFSSYKWYGGRGIEICERWLGESGFRNFMEDMGEVPPGLTLERQDNSGNYEPSNCRWATKKEQCRNRRTNVLFTFRGKTQTLVAWSEEYGLKHTLLYNRLYQGIDFESALSQP